MDRKMKLIKSMKEKFLYGFPLAALGTLMIIFSSNMSIVGILAHFGIYNPPSWLVTALLIAATLSAIAFLLSLAGIAVSAALVTALNAAGTVAA